MNARRLFFALTMLTGMPILAASAASAQALHLFAVLRGANELPAADANGSGTAMVSFRGANLATICVTLFVDGIDTPLVFPNGAHIHRGGGSVNGPVVVQLSSPTAGAASTSTRCVAIAPALSTEIRAKPYAFYVNIHTGAFGGGAIRGQLF